MMKRKPCNRQRKVITDVKIKYYKNLEYLSREYTGTLFTKNLGSRMFEVYKSLRFFTILDLYLSLLLITDANIEIFKYSKSLSKQYQFTPVYKKLSYLLFFASQLLLVTNVIVFFVNFGPFFDIVCPVASAKISQEGKNPCQDIKLHVCTKNHDI